MDGDFNLLQQASTHFHNHEFSAALRALDDLISREDTFQPRDGAFRCYLIRGYVHASLGDWEAALCDFRSAREADRRFLTDEIGTAHWVLGRRDEACQEWAAEIERRRSGEIKMLDSAGGVLAPALLWWAAAHPPQQSWRKLAIDELRKRWKTKWCRASAWPGPIAGFLLGHLTSNQFLTAADCSVLRLQERQVCQAHFYIGAKCLEIGDVDG